MAYMSQERKSQIAPVVKAICKKYGVKASLAVDHHSTLVLNVKSGPLDFIGNANNIAAEKERRNAEFINMAKDYIQVNTYWYHDHFSGKCKAFMKEVITAMNEGNWDKSDIQTDYFNVGWYVNVNVGRWDKPYQLVK